MLVCAARASALAKDDILRLHHRDSVGRGVLTEHQFWSSRKTLLEREMYAMKPHQRSAFTAFSARIEPVIEGNKMIYRLTRRDVQRIFICDPVVKECFDERVPSEMTKGEFFVSYFQSGYYNKTGFCDDMFTRKAAEHRVQARDGYGDLLRQVNRFSNLACAHMERVPDDRVTRTYIPLVLTPPAPSPATASLMAIDLCAPRPEVPWFTLEEVSETLDTVQLSRELLERVQTLQRTVSELLRFLHFGGRDQDIYTHMLRVYTTARLEFRTMPKTIETSHYAGLVNRVLKPLHDLLV